VYLSYLMLRALAPCELTAAQQREEDERLGRMAAAVARCRRHGIARVHAVAIMPFRGGRQPESFRNGPARRAPDRA
jgi:hypothetical protein